MNWKKLESIQGPRSVLQNPYFASVDKLGKFMS